MLYGIGLTDADLQKPQVGICSMWYEGNTCNMHLDRLAAQVKEGVSGGRARRPPLQHHRRQRRPVDGHRGHELFAAVARPDRRLDRDGDGRAVVRRAHHRSRLRQEHAGQRHRDGAAQPPGADGVRRHDPRGLCARQAARHHLRIPVVRRVPRRRRSPTSSGSTSFATRARAPARAAGCTPPTRWPSRSRRSACRCRTARRSRPRIPGKADECRRAGAAVRAAARARSEAARHPHAARRSRTP